VERAVTSNSDDHAWRLAWIAYVWPILRYGLVLAIVGEIELIPWWVSALLLVRLAYVLAYLRSIKIYLDEQGVWKQFGLLPWSKGAHGVKWRDLDQAEIFFGFIPWLTNAHRVRVGHRFTKASEIVVPAVWDARGLIEAINSEHERLARSGALS
jgi:hypothetical protein